MAVVYLKPSTAHTDSDSNVSSGSYTSIDEGVAGATGDLMVAVNDNWTNQSTASITFPLENLPADADVINSIKLRVRAQIAGDATPDDTIIFTWDVIGTGAPTGSVTWSNTADATASGSLVNREVTLSGTPTVLEINALSIRLRQTSYSRSMAADGTHHDWDAIELEVDYTPTTTITQRAFRFVDDDGSESGSTFLAALNTDYTGDRDTVYRCRLGIDNPGGSEANSFRIQKRIDGGSWSDLTADGSDVRLVLSTHFADLDPTTERLAGSRTFVAGDMIEGSGTDNADSGSITLGIDQETEIEFTFEVIGLKGAQTIEFRARRSPSTDLDSYVETPIFTVDSTAVQTVLRTTFPTPSSSLLTGAGKQKFRAWVRRDSKNSGTGTPNVDFFLYEGGTQKQVLTANTSITSDAGQLVEATWNATNLTSVDGSGVECRIVGDVGGTGAQARTVEFGAVEWCVEHAAGAGPITGSVTFTVDNAHTFNNTMTANKTHTFNLQADQVFENAKTAIELMLYNIELNKLIQSQGIISKSQSFNINLTQLQNYTLSKNEAVAFIIQLIQLNQNNKVAPISINLQGTLEFLFNNVINTNKSITLDALLDKIISPNKVTTNLQEFILNLSQAQVSTISLDETISFINQLQQNQSVNKITSESILLDSLLDYLLEISKTGQESISLDLLLDQIIAVVKVTEEIQTFLVQLDQDQTATISIEEAITLITQLQQDQSVTKTVSDSIILDNLLDYLLEVNKLGQESISLDLLLNQLNSANTVSQKAIVLNTVLDQTISLDRIVNEIQTFLVQLDQDQTTTISTEEAITFITQLQQNQLVNKIISESVTLDNLLDYLLEVNKLGQESISLEVLLDKIISSDRIINEIQTFLVQLDQDQTATISTEEAIIFITQLQQDQSVTKTVSDSIILDNLLDYLLEVNKLGQESLSLDLLLNQLNSANKVTTDLYQFIVNLTQDTSAVIGLVNAITFAVELDKLQTTQKITSETLNIQSTLDFLNILNSIGAKTISFDVLLTKLIEGQKNTTEAKTFVIDLLQQHLAVITIQGSVNLNIIKTFSPDNFKTVLTQMNADIVLTQSEQVVRLLSEVHNYSFNLSFDAFNTGARAASLTFTDELGLLQTVGLTGEAVQLFQAQLTEEIAAIKTAEEATVFNMQLLDQTVNNLIALTDLSLDIQLLQNNIYERIVNTNVTFESTFNLLIDINSDLIRAISFLTDLDINFQKGIFKPGSITFNINTLKTVEVQQILKPIITLLTTLTFNIDKQAILEKSISYLVELQQTQLGNIGAITVVGAVTFLINMQLAQNNQVDGVAALQIITELAKQSNAVLNTSETITFIKELSDNYTSNISIDKLLNLSINLLQQQNVNLDAAGTLSLILQLAQITTGTRSLQDSINLIIQMSDELAVQLTKEEILLLSLQLSDIYSNTGSLLSSTVFNVEMQQLQNNLVNKLLTMSFISVLNYVPTNTVDFNTIANFASILTTNFFGDTTGAETGLLTFAVQLAQNNVVLNNKFPSLSFANLLNFESLAGISILDNLEFSVQLDDTVDINLTKEGLVSLQTFFQKTIETNIDYRPSVDFDIQAIQTSIANKNTLASLLLNVDAGLTINNYKVLPSFINYIIEQDIQSTINLTATGEITLPVELEDSITLQLLAQSGITFGHLLSLATLTGSDFYEAINFGIIQDITVEGFVLRINIITPKGRTLTIIFEDRTVLVHKETRRRDN
jgi:hypothetical protein